MQHINEPDKATHNDTFTHTIPHTHTC